MPRIIPCNSTELFNFVISNLKLRPELILDLTLGKGRDTYKLHNRFPNANIFAFDIQSEAIEESKKLFKGVESKKVKFFKENHIYFDELLKNSLDRGIDLAVFNFGYLPGYDKSITTEKEGSLKALKKVLRYLNKSGLVMLTFYPGHKSGLEEYELLSDFIENLNQKDYLSLEFNFTNQVNNPPIFSLIERL